MFKNILVPVALGDTRDRQGALLAAQKLLDDGGKITLLHVRQEIPDYASAQIPAEVLANARREIEKTLSEIAAGVPGAETALADGAAGRAIVDYADDTGADCIVVASHKPGIQDFFIGSTAARVVSHAKCAVVVLR